MMCGRPQIMDDAICVAASTHLDMVLNPCESEPPTIWIGAVAVLLPPSFLEYVCLKKKTVVQAIHSHGLTCNRQ